MLKEMLTNLGAGLPKVIGAIAVLVIGLLVAKIISKIIRKALVAVNVDSIGEKLNEIDIVEKSNIKIKISTILSKVVYYFLILIFLMLATDILDMAAVSELVLKMTTLVPKIIVAGVILIIGTLVSDGIRGIAQTTLESLGIPSSRMIASFIFYFLFISFIGYGLASKSSMSNFLASYYSTGKFDIGDTITMDGVTGKVVEMDKSSLILIAENGNKVIFPLSQISNSKIEIYN